MAETPILTPAGRALAERLRAAASYGEKFAGGPKHAFVDANGDGKCDECGMAEEMHSGSTAADTTTLAKADHPFVDDNGDGKCDICDGAEANHDGKMAADTDCVECGETVTAAAGDVQVEIDPKNPGRFKAILAVEGERTADNRIIDEGAIKWRDTPLPLMLMTKTADGHDGAEVAGLIENIEREGANIIGEGRFDTGPAGLEAARLVANKVLRGVSIDAGDVEASLEVEGEDGDGNPTAVLARMSSLVILGATICPFQAIGSASIEWVQPLANDDALPLEEAEAVTAAGPRVYDAALFADPGFSGPTPLRVRQVGSSDVWHVEGHAAVWGQCHISYPGACVTPPKTRTNYSHFLTGALPTESGKSQPVGTITLNTNHPTDRPYTAREAALHYDHTGTAAAFVNVGEDDHGIWVSGVLKPGLDEECATVLSASSLSGDWRRIGGNLELVALLSVNTPGYPVAYTRDEEQVALVAAGFGHIKPTRSHETLAREARYAAEHALAQVELQNRKLDELADQVAALSRAVAPMVRERLGSRIGEDERVASGDDKRQALLARVNVDAETGEP